LSCFLQKNISIQYLNLSSTGIESDGFKNICEALKNSPCIHELDFSFLEVADSGCIAIGNMLKQNKSLTKLRLRSANISWIGCGILFEGVQQSKTLVELDMSRNFIGDDGMEMMCRHLN
jgi:Ran GTPase-activating protein (RanGAP) involved in mRNA processing and transport